ncbi:MAG: hypothetical protein PF508_05580 [Spirochaeta sp.]|jgi:hypothetical protein|nr:hypothetical protein [Spirochaeta sp.]
MNRVETTKDITTLKAMLSDERLDLRHDHEWEEIAEHVQVHKYFVNQEIKWTITWDDAVFSWYENVFTPMMDAITAWEIKNAFPQKTRGQLYLAVATHWHFLKERDSRVTIEAAARDFAGSYGTGLARWFSRFLQPAMD